MKNNCHIKRQGSIIILEAIKGDVWYELQVSEGTDIYKALEKVLEHAV